MRPRIRTIKPEVWADERIGAMSREARLLFVGLITLADDEGRFRALPSAVLGHIFPYDLDAPRRFSGWWGEVVGSGLVLAYEHRGVQYGCFPNWERHQKVNRKTASILPDPSLNDH